MTTPTRIVLGEMPRLVRDLIEQEIAEIPELAVVAHDDGGGSLAGIAEETHAELVIVAMDGEGLPPAAQEYLERRARLAAVGVEVEDGTATLYVLRPHRRPIGPVSPRELVAAIREAAEEVK